MITKTRVTVQRTEITDIHCTCCGESLLESVHENVDDQHPEFGNKEYRFKEHLSISKTWGYESTGKDGETWSAQICEPCVEKHLSTIPWEKGNYLFPRVDEALKRSTQRRQRSLQK